MVHVQKNLVSLLLQLFFVVDSSYICMTAHRARDIEIYIFILYGCMYGDGGFPSYTYNILSNNKKISAQQVNIKNVILWGPVL